MARFGPGGVYEELGYAGVFCASGSPAVKSWIGNVGGPLFQRNFAGDGGESLRGGALALIGWRRSRFLSL